MDAIPLYVQAGAIAGYITAAVLIILHFPAIEQRVRSLTAWFYKWLRERPMAFNEWRWWRDSNTQLTVDTGGNSSITDGAFEIRIYT